MNISRTFFTLLFFALGQSAATGQAFRQTYAPTGSFCRDLLETPDGGFLMVGGILSDSALFLQKTDAAGQPVWTNHLALDGARAIAACPAPGGGYAVLAENRAGPAGLDNVVLKIDENGLVEWTLTLDNPLLPNGFHDIAATTDGALAVAGEARDSALALDFRVLKLDASGAVVWDKTFGFPGFDELASRVVALPGGQLAVGGVRKTGAGVRDFALARLALDGSLLWLNAYEKPGYQLACDLTATTDGGLMLFGDTYQISPTKLSYLKVDAFGTEQWFRQYDPVGSPVATYVAHSLARDDVDNFYAPVYAGTPGADSLNLFVVDANGNFLLNKKLPFADLPWVIIRTSDYRIAYAGETNSSLAAALAKLDEIAELPANLLSGRLFWDRDANCAATPDEADTPPIFLVKAVNQFDEAFYQFVYSPLGAYNLPVSEGDFTVTARAVAGDPGLWTACDTPTVSVSGNGLTILVPDLGLQSPAVCPLLDVSVGKGLLRRCSTAVYTVNYCNFGNSTASDVSVQFTADTLLIYQSGTIPPASQNGNVLIFNVPDLAPGECGALQLTFGVSCYAEIGDAICASAHIFPDTSCLPPDPNWDGSNLEVSAACDGDAHFTIRNTGSPMSGAADYVIIEDQIIMMQGAIQLGGGGDSTLTIPNAGGHSYYLRAEQRPGHPAGDEPAAALNSCGGSGGPNLALQLPYDNPSPAEAVVCDEVIGSYDPNDKRGFPLGWQDAHYLEPGQAIDYQIRFQNTGNDTAFTVVLRDTLSNLFDVASVRPGPASHPYHFDFEGNVLVFRFDNILLPDSATNEAASQGYAYFRAAPRADLPLGTVLENDAAIYFDFNAPVITNSYFHTLGQPLITFIDERPGGREPALSLRVQPNPFGEEARLRVDGADADERFRLTVYDAQGRPLRADEFSGPEHVFQRKNLPAGWYFYQLQGSDGKTAAGKILVQ